jgi:hypothetical protein
VRCGAVRCGAVEGGGGRWGGGGGRKSKSISLFACWMVNKIAGDSSSEMKIEGASIVDNSLGAGSQVRRFAG